MLKKIKGLFSGDGRELKELQKTVDQINDLAETFKDLSDEELKAKTEEFKKRLSDGETLDDLLVEAFAVVKETATRTLGMTPYDVQIMGGIALHNSKIAEMQTGEGKTLAATLPAYLNALEGKGVHIMTTNDYLAQRDAEWMGKVYEFLGLTVGHVKAHSTIQERQKAYVSDITYAQSREVVFDYMRTKMAPSPKYFTVEILNYAIVDEADSILIDEARTPIGLSGIVQKDLEEYEQYTELANLLVADTHYEINHEKGQVGLTDEGISEIEKLMEIDNLYSTEYAADLAKLQNAITAKELLEKDRNYIVKDNKIVLIDHFTGRLVENSRFPDGVQQAIEAKEGTKLSEEYVTKGMITYPNFLRLYNRVSGMTGTAKTEAGEFEKTYGLNVVVIPTNKPVIREDLPDVIFKKRQAKFNAILEDVKERHAKGQPILIGSDSVDESMEVHELFKKENLPHEVLNANNHEREAEIVKNAGQKDSITIITNMAGRGTDIQLGEGVVELGGLHVVGVTRNESRRIDNQLRGRSGRQGDPGSTQYYISLEDRIVKNFGGDDAMEVLDRIKIKDDMPIQNVMVNKLIQNIQMKCEASNGQMRRYIQKFDDILNEQRDTFYETRFMFLLSSSEDLKDHILTVYNEVITRNVEFYCEDEFNEEWDIEGLVKEMNQFFFEEDQFSIDDFKDIEEKEEVIDTILARSLKVYERKEGKFDQEQYAQLLRQVSVTLIDKEWIEHLEVMEYLRKGLGLRSYARNPFLDFSVEAYDMFEDLNHRIQEEIMKNTILLEIQVVKK